MTTNVQPSQPIQLACLDMAGTTVNDEGAVEEAFRSALSSVEVGADDPRLPAMLDYVTETMGTSKITVFKALFSEDNETAEIANRAFEASYYGIVGAGRVAPIPGAEEAIRTLQSSGIKVALLTGFSATTRDHLVKALQWERIADLLVCPQEAGRGRPYPDMILNAIIKLGIDDVSAVAVVGDTAADIESGRRAGSSVIAGVLTGADDSSRLMAAGATTVLQSIDDLPALLKCL